MFCSFPPTKGRRKPKLSDENSELWSQNQKSRAKAQASQFPPDKERNSCDSEGGKKGCYSAQRRRGSISYRTRFMARRLTLLAPLP